jgi:flagellar protein FlgJ
MLDVMRKTVQKDGLLDGGMSEEVFQDMLYGEYARKMAETAQFGLSDLIYRQVSSKR